MPWQVGQFAGTSLDFFPVGVPSHFCLQETLLQCILFSLQKIWVSLSMVL